MEFIDTHYHLFDDRFRDDYREVLEEDRAAGMACAVLPAIDSGSHDALLALARLFPQTCYPAIGLHPTSVRDRAFTLGELAEVERFLSEPPVPFVAVGEIGLDFYWSREFETQQIEAFRMQLALAEQYRLPVLIHTRDAYAAMREILSEYKQVRGILHGFSGDADDYSALRESGRFLFGIGGVVTFRNASLRALVKEMALEDMVLETDAPYLAPVPYRGKRNQAKYIPQIAEEIGRLKNIPAAEVTAVTTRNAKQMLNIL